MKRTAGTLSSTVPLRRPMEWPLYCDELTLRNDARVTRGQGHGFRRWVLPPMSRRTA